MYYENINGKEKKIMKKFTDADKFNAFAKKYPMPTIGTMFWLLPTPKKAITSKTIKKVPTAKNKRLSPKK